MEDIRCIASRSQPNKIIIYREGKSFFSGRVDHQFVAPQVIEVVHGVGRDGVNIRFRKKPSQFSFQRNRLEFSNARKTEEMSANISGLKYLVI